MRFFQNRRGQGTTEYIVILGLVVAIATFVFWDTLKGKLASKAGQIVDKIKD